MDKISKAVLISIRPEWVEKIAEGQKTVEVRRTRPKLEPPFKCYIYCTNTRPFLVRGHVFRGGWYTKFTHISGIGRAEADRIWDVFNGHVAGEFVCDTYVTDKTFGHDALFNAAACMSESDVVAYSAGTPLYGWHISDLKIYDAPKKLGDFWRDCPEYSELSTNCWSCENVCGDGNETDCNTDGRLYLHRPPQSWCYVEELK